MRAAVVSAASVLALAAGASAAPFQFLSYEAGGGLAGITGVGFQASAGNFFKSTNNSGPTGGPFSFFGLDLTLEFDTYFSIDPIGPSGKAGSTTDGFYGFGADHEANNLSGTPDALSLGTGSNITGGAAQVGVGISPQPFFSGLAPDGRDGVFVMRATIEAGGSVLGGGLFSIKSSVGITEGADVNLDGTNAVLDGQLLGLVAYLSADSSNNGGLGDTYDVWFQVIPTPGTLALLGLGGVAAIRRRRA